MKKKMGKGRSNTGKQARGEMHLQGGADSFATPGEHAGPKDWHIGHLGCCPSDEYEDGGDTENERCEHD